MKWFRFWSEALHKPKIRRLPHALYRFWTQILCIACENDPWGTLPSLEDVADMARVREEKAKEYLKELESRGLVDRTPDGTLRPHGWERWQKPSDSSTERVRAFRKRDEAVSETAPEKDTDTEQRQIQKKSRADPSGTGAAVDVYRSLPGVVRSKRDGPVLAGLIGRHGLEAVLAKIHDEAPALAAADSPLLLLASRFRKNGARPPRTGPSLVERKAEVMKNLGGAP